MVSTIYRLHPVRARGGLGGRATGTSRGLARHPSADEHELVDRLARLLRLDVFRSTTAPVWAVIGAILVGVAAAKAYLGIPLRVLMGDPAGVTGRPFYLGLVSNVGVLLWTSTASIFLFTSSLQRRAGDEEWRRYLLWSGLFVAWLGLDDLFMLHDGVFRDELSIPQPLVMGTYVVLVFVYLARFAPQIVRTAYPVLLAAFGLLGTSMALDQIYDQFHVGLPARLLWEDGSKVLGIGAWLSYAIHTSAAILRGDPAREA